MLKFLLLFLFKSYGSVDKFPGTRSGAMFELISLSSSNEILKWWHKVRSLFDTDWVLSIKSWYCITSWWVSKYMKEAASEYLLSGNACDFVISSLPRRGAEKRCQRLHNNRQRRQEVHKEGQTLEYALTARSLKHSGCHFDPIRIAPYDLDNEFPVLVVKMVTSHNHEPWNSSKN